MKEREKNRDSRSRVKFDNRIAVVANFEPPVYWRMPVSSAFGSGVRAVVGWKVRARVRECAAARDGILATGVFLSPPTLQFVSYSVHIYKYKRARVWPPCSVATA